MIIRNKEYVLSIGKIGFKKAAPLLGLMMIFSWQALAGGYSGNGGGEITDVGSEENHRGVFLTAKQQPNFGKRLLTNSAAAALFPAIGIYYLSKVRPHKATVRKWAVTGPKDLAQRIMSLKASDIENSSRHLSPPDRDFYKKLLTEKTKFTSDILSSEVRVYAWNMRLGGQRKDALTSHSPGAPVYLSTESLSWFLAGDISYDDKVPYERFLALLFHDFIRHFKNDDDYRFAKAWVITQSPAHRFSAQQGSVFKDSKVPANFAYYLVAQTLLSMHMKFDNVASQFANRDARTLFNRYSCSNSKDYPFKMAVSDCLSSKYKGYEELRSLVINSLDALSMSNEFSKAGIKSKRLEALLCYLGRSCDKTAKRDTSLAVLNAAFSEADKRFLFNFEGNPSLKEWAAFLLKDAYFDVGLFSK